MTDYEARMSQNAEHPMGRYGDELRNALADPEFVERQNRLMFEEVAKIREYRKRNALYEIQGQPFFGRLYD